MSYIYNMGMFGVENKRLRDMLAEEYDLVPLENKKIKVEEELQQVEKLEPVEELEPLKKIKPIALGNEDFPDLLFKLICNFLNLEDQKKLCWVNINLRKKFWSVLYPQILKKVIINPQYSRLPQNKFLETINTFKKYVPLDLCNYHIKDLKIHISISNDRYSSLVYLKDFIVEELDYSQQLDQEDYKFAPIGPHNFNPEREFLKLKPGKIKPAAIPEGLSLSFPHLLTKLTLKRNHLNNRDLLAIAPLINLTYLDVSHNLLSRVGVRRITEQFPKLTYLNLGMQILEFEKLAIQGKDIPYLNSLKHLETLDIRFASLVGYKSSDVLGGLSKTLKTLRLQTKIFKDFDVLNLFQLEHLSIDDVEWSDAFKQISVLKDSLKTFAFTRIVCDNGEDLSNILIEFEGFSKLEEIRLGSFSGFNGIQNEKNFYHLQNCPIKRIYLDYINASKLGPLLSFNHLVKIRLHNCQIDKKNENLMLLAQKNLTLLSNINKIDLGLHLYEPTVDDLKFVDTLGLKKLGFNRIQNENILYKEKNLFDNSVEILARLELEEVSCYSQILNGLNLSKLKVRTSNDRYKIDCTNIRTLTGHMTKLKELKIKSYGEKQVITF